MSPPAPWWASGLADRLAALWALAIGGLLFGLLWRSGYDDPYITYRYAANLAAGQGFVYNVGEPVLSTTTPLYTLILSLAGLVRLDIPTSSNLLSCASLALGGWLLWRLGQHWGTPLVGLTGLLLYPIFPQLTMTIGAETAFYSALVLSGMLAAARGAARWAALWLALATLTRADGALALVACGLLIALERWRATRGAGVRAFARSLPWDALAIYAVLVLPWFLFAQLYFGGLFPVTLAAKQQQGQMSISAGFIGGLVRSVQQIYWPTALYRLHFGLAALGALAALRPTPWRLPIGWALLYTLGYALLGVSGYFWYYAPLLIGFVPLIGLGLAALTRWAGRWRAWPQRLTPPIVALMLVLLLGAELRTLLEAAQRPDPRLAIYSAVGAWLRANTPADTSVAALEVGIIGYAAERRMVDFAGLIQPAVARQLRRDRTYDDAAIWALAALRPDYVTLVPGQLPRLERDPTFSATCRAADTVTVATKQMLIYRCRW